MEGDTNTPVDRLTAGCENSIDGQYAVGVSRAVIFASSGEGSMVRKPMDISGVVTVSRDNFVASSGEGSLWFRSLWHGQCRSEGPVVGLVPRWLKQR